MIELDSEKEERLVKFRRFLNKNKVKEAKILLFDDTELTYKAG